jgi:hypothetical protein
MPISLLFAVTLAAGTLAPVWSVTVPVNVAETCAAKGDKKQIARSRVRIMSVLKDSVA